MPLTSAGWIIYVLQHNILKEIQATRLLHTQKIKQNDWLRPNVTSVPHGSHFLFASPCRVSQIKHCKYNSLGITFFSSPAA